MTNKLFFSMLQIIQSICILYIRKITAWLLGCKAFLYISDWRSSRRVHPGWFSRRWCHAVRYLGTGKTVFCSWQESVLTVGSGYNLLWEMASLIINRPMDLGYIYKKLSTVWQKIKLMHMASFFLKLKMIPWLSIFGCIVLGENNKQQQKTPVFRLFVRLICFLLIQAFIHSYSFINLSHKCVSGLQCLRETEIFRISLEIWQDVIGDLSPGEETNNAFESTH